MDTKELKEKWPVLKDKIIKEYPQLTADELVLQIGREEELLLKLQEKLGKNRKDIFYMLSLMG